MHYRRADIEGGTYFFTVNLAERSSRLLVERVDALRDDVTVVKPRHPFHFDAWVVLPDHRRAIWTLPEGDEDFATRWMLIKAGFSRRIETGERLGASRRHKGERGIWQRRYWEHLIRDETDFAIHVDYVHISPVKHGHAMRAADWPLSSIHRYIAAGTLNRDWAVDSDMTTVLAGEVLRCWGSLSLTPTYRAVSSNVKNP